MGWVEFKAWLREMNRSRQRQAGRSTTAPGSWAGRDHDAFWRGRRDG